MAERLSAGKDQVQKFSNGHTDRGHELEPLARDIYELETGNKVETVGFVKLNDYIGCSPDGLVAEEGGTEIKCINDIDFVKHLDLGESQIDSDHRWQVQMNLFITGRKWWDLLIYNPNFRNSLIVYRIFPDPEAQQKLKDGLALGEQMIKDLVAKLK